MLFDSQIATASNPQLLRQSVAKPTEQTWLYDRLDPPFETELYKDLHSRFGDVPALDRLFRFAHETSSTLGAWCSDWIWSYGLAEEVIPQIGARTDSEVQRIRAAGEKVKAHEFEDPHDKPNLLSSKVRRLHHELSRYFERRTDTKCIIFTEKRHTARILSDLFSRIRTPHLCPGWLTGVRAGDNEGTKLTFRDQLMTLVAFKKGEINCLVRRPEGYTYVCKKLSD